MSKDAKKTLLACTIALVLVVVSTASAEQKDRSDLWPLKRQQVLTGTYTGQLTSYTQDCQTVRAELFLSMPTPSRNMQRYTLKTTCIAGNQLNGPTRTITGAWDMDEASGSCLVLNFIDVDDPMVGPNIYGFDVEEDPLHSDHKHHIYVLAQDGHNCHSGKSPEYDDKVLRRVP
ncbi:MULTISPECIES: hypothetical protein [unclassified Xanthomonas]|uniref:hypothetical protein n=1 Tax=unclassified Xanthomonas TaxID=2643310 RepID=UPI002B2240D2|nr:MULTISPECIES: hypothetical protein [unclassified Xanthomonas]MEA9564809.1 hypothetical protein [Xanthomonas sp. WHRI 8932A]MEA9635195.1 hypothetical protein [Xanthomonas sp. WHRI 8812E]